VSINLTTIALAIFVICAGFVLLRGILKILLGCLVLGASAWAALRLWQLGPELVKACFGAHLQWLASLLPIAAFLIVFLAGRILVKFLTSPFRNPDNPRPPLTLIRLLSAAVFTLVPTGLILTILMILIYHAGSISEIKQSTRSSTPTPATGFIQDLKSSVEKSIPPAWLQLLDPLTDPSRLALAKIITQQSQPQRTPAIDPHTGKPIPRAIIVDDPELQNLAREGRFATLLRSPLLTKALNDPKVQDFLQHFQS
jgi:hypothetical protein